MLAWLRDGGWSADPFLILLDRICAIPAPVLPGVGLSEDLVGESFGRSASRALMEDAGLGGTQPVLPRARSIPGSDRSAGVWREWRLWATGNPLPRRPGVSRSRL